MSLNGNLKKTFAKYVSLNIAGMLGVSCYIMADTFFISLGVGATGLTALNIVMPAYSILYGVGLMFGMGGATLFAISAGQGNKKKGNELFMQSMFFAVLLGAIFTVIGCTLSREIASLLGADETIVGMGSEYLKTILYFSIMFTLNQVVTAFVRNDGAPNLAMLGMVIGSLSNVLLDYIFIFPLGMGMFGAALATGIAPIVSLLILSLHWIRKKNTLKFVRLKIDLKSLAKTVSVGFSSFLYELSNGTVIILFNNVILGIAGNIGVAAYSVVANIALIVAAIFTGTGQGMQPIISNLYGAGRKKDMNKVFFWGLAVAAVIGALVIVFGEVFAESLAAIFNSGNDAVLGETAARGIRLYFSAYVFMGINLVTIAFFAAVSKAKLSFLLSILRGLVFVIAFIFPLSALLQLDGVWLTVPFAELSTMVVAIVALTLMFKKEKKTGTAEFSSASLDAEVFGG